MSVGEMTREILLVDAMPDQRELLPHEVAIQIGCGSCTSELARRCIIQASRGDRSSITNTLRVLSETTDVPVTVKISSNTTQIGVTHQSSSCDAGNKPCQDPAALELFKSEGLV